MLFSSAAAQLLEHCVAKVHGKRKGHSKKLRFDHLKHWDMSDKLEWSKNITRFNNSIMQAVRWGSPGRCLCPQPRHRQKEIQLGEAEHPRGRMQKWAVTSGRAAVCLDKPPWCWSCFFQAPLCSTKEEKFQQDGRHAGCLLLPRRCGAVEGCLMITSSTGRMRLSCFGSASKLQSNSGKPHPGRRLGRGGCFVV